MRFAESTVSEMNTVCSTIDELRRQVAENEDLIKCTNWVMFSPGFQPFKQRGTAPYFIKSVVSMILWLLQRDVILILWHSDL